MEIYLLSLIAFGTMLGLLLVSTVLAYAARFFGDFLLNTKEWDNLDLSFITNKPKKVLSWLFSSKVLAKSLKELNDMRYDLSKWQIEDVDGWGSKVKFCGAPVRVWLDGEISIRRDICVSSMSKASLLSRIKEERGLLFTSNRSDDKGPLVLFLILGAAGLDVLINLFVYFPYLTTVTMAVLGTVFGIRFLSGKLAQTVKRTAKNETDIQDLQGKVNANS